MIPHVGRKISPNKNRMIASFVAEGNGGGTFRGRHAFEGGSRRIPCCGFCVFCEGAGGAKVFREEDGKAERGESKFVAVLMEKERECCGGNKRVGRPC